LSVGLKARRALFAGGLRLRGGPRLDAARVTPVFTRALPENLAETAGVVKTARQAGAMSTRTMVEMLHQSAGWDESMIARETEDAMKESREENA
jgi:cytochrome c-type biogenesis protein CcmE